ncbi:MAG: hypothetical protein ACK5H4_07640 [Lacrimispora sphenoides]
MIIKKEEPDETFLKRFIRLFLLAEIVKDKQQNKILAIKGMIHNAHGNNTFVCA